jgi:C-terminal processing protease CtpA/Prc
MNYDRETMRHLIEQASIVLGEFFVHLQQKTARHAFDPMVALRLLKSRVDSDEIDSDEFHKEMFDIFRRLKDNHTRYSLAEESWATMPFSIEKYYEQPRRGDAKRSIGRKPVYVISHISKALRRLAPQGFKKGTRVTHWNGVPMERVIEIVGDQFWGANVPATLAQGMLYLTRRPLDRSPEPAEQWVDVRFRVGDRSSTRRFKWRKDESLVSKVPEKPYSPGRSGMDRVLRRAQESKKVLATRESSTDRRRARTLLRERFGVSKLVRGSFFRWANLTFNKRRYGYVRIYEFLALDDVGIGAAFEEFTEVLGRCGGDGLILDIRENPGGDIRLADAMLQSLTGRKLERSLFQFRNSRRVVDMVENNPLLSPWKDSLKEAAETGAPFSQGIPIGEFQPPRRGPAYRGRGPIVLIVDALCYSASDMFAAGFQDNGIGTIIGVDSRTGAGGANAWPYETLQQYANFLFAFRVPRPGRRPTQQEIRRELEKHPEIRLANNQLRGPEARVDPDDGLTFTWLLTGRNNGGSLNYGIHYSPDLDTERAIVISYGRDGLLKPLPKEVAIEVSVRRAIRSGQRSGFAIEDVGVEPDLRHYTTRNDVLYDNVDLLQFAIDHLASKLDIERSPKGTKIRVSSRNLERVTVEALSASGTLLRKWTPKKWSARGEIVRKISLPAFNRIRAVGFRRNEVVRERQKQAGEFRNAPIAEA